MQHDSRVYFVLIVFFVGLGFLGYRLFNLAVRQHEFYSNIISRQSKSGIFLSPQRGEIFIQDMAESRIVPAATNKRFPFVEVVPAEVTEYDAVVNAVIPAFRDIAPEQLLKIVKNNAKPLLRRRITEEMASDIELLQLDGVRVTAERTRYYPLALAPHALGFWGFSDEGERVGQYGIEGYYEDVLNGSLLSVDDDSSGNFFSRLAYSGFLERLYKRRAQDGSSLVLTVDKNIQFYAERQLDAVMKRWDAAGGSLIVQDPDTGAILAITSSPSFDPNDYGAYEYHDFVNSAVQEVFEPGSSFKPITAAAALDLEAITPSTTYKDPGTIYIGQSTIKNFNEKSFGVQTMTQVLEKSLNTGAIFMQRRIGGSDFLRYVEAFGFGKETGIDMYGEVSGNVDNLYVGREINFATASFGQGISVTPIQLIAAYSAIANGGVLMRPYVVEEIIHPDGRKVKTESEVVGRPVKESTAFSLTEMLVSVVDNGFDRARVEGYDIAGKTGTAQIPGPEGKYLENDEFIHNFVGFAPASDPQFTVLIKIDRPKGIRFSSDSLSPVFGDIARFLINYFGIPPTR